jgi:MoxR-like ATPase
MANRFPQGNSRYAFEKSEDLDHPRHYVAEDGLRNAVNVAVALGQPLLVTGEPGTGKTQLAYSIAYELELPDKDDPGPLVFNTKTTSTASDLFYRYDALAHFHDAQFKRDEQINAAPYIKYQALGRAIQLAMTEDDPNRNDSDDMRGKKPVRSVVLIDEIDKAPRDLPNDVLNEIENMSFRVKETGLRFTADQSCRPILVLTSNSEKNLPDAFLRRCVFYHISFPSGTRLKEIVSRRIKPTPEFTDDKIDNAVLHFEEIRRMGLAKPPATAEFLAWLRVLERKNLDVKNLKPGEQVALTFTYSILAKSKEDKEKLDNLLSSSPKT